MFASGFAIMNHCSTQQRHSHAYACRQAHESMILPCKSADSFHVALLVGAMADVADPMQPANNGESFADISTTAVLTVLLIVVVLPLLCLFCKYKMQQSKYKMQQSKNNVVLANEANDSFDVRASQWYILICSCVLKLLRKGNRIAPQEGESLDRTTCKEIPLAISKDSAPQKMCLQVAWRASGMKDAHMVTTPASMNDMLALTTHSFIGYRLDSKRFLAIETHGAIFADYPRLDELAFGSVIIVDRGGVLCARTRGAEECIIVGRHYQLDREQPCACYLLDTETMWNADGSWGLVLQGEMASATTA